MWLASVWSFVFQTAKEAATAEGKHSATADAEMDFPPSHSWACIGFHAPLSLLIFAELLVLFSFEKFLLGMLFCGTFCGQCHLLTYEHFSNFVGNTFLCKSWEATQSEVINHDPTIRYRDFPILLVLIGQEKKRIPSKIKICGKMDANPSRLTALPHSRLPTPVWLLNSAIVCWLFLERAGSGLNRSTLGCCSCGSEYVKK